VAASSSTKLDSDTYPMEQQYKGCYVKNAVIDLANRNLANLT
jgi:hypothetical protein